MPKVTFEIPDSVAAEAVEAIAHCYGCAEYQSNVDKDCTKEQFVAVATLRHIYQMVESVVNDGHRRNTEAARKAVEDSFPEGI